MRERTLRETTIEFLAELCEPVGPFVFAGYGGRIARLRRQLDKAERRLVTTEAALVIMGKAHDLLDVLTKRSRDDSEHTTR